MLQHLVDHFRALFADAESLVPEAKTFLRRFWGVFAVAIALVLGGFIFGMAAQTSNANAETWELTIASRLFLLRLLGGVLAFIVAVAVAMLTASWMDNTSVGDRLFRKNSDGSGFVKVFVALLITAALVLAGAVR